MLFFLEITKLYSKQLDNLLPGMLLGKEDNTTSLSSTFANLLELSKKNQLSQPVVNKLLCQLFYFIDAQSFNALLKRTDLFNASGGFQIKMSLSKLEGSLGKLDKQLHLITKNLNHIKEVANLLVIDKSVVSDEDAIKSVFSNVNIRVVDHVLQKFKPDEMAPDTIPDTIKRNVSLAAKNHPELKLELDPSEVKFWPDL